MKIQVLVLACSTWVWACPLCGGSNPWQSAEGQAGMQLGRLRRVYKSPSRYDQPIKIESRESDAEKAASRSNGEAVPSAKTPPPPKPKSKDAKPKG